MDLAEKVGFDQWSKAFHCSLCHELNEERVPLYHMITKVEGLVNNIVIKPLLEKYRQEGGTELYRNRCSCYIGLGDYH